jgi:serine protease Do
MKVLRDKTEKTLNITVDELDLENETARAGQPDAQQEPEEEAGAGFGMTMGTLSADIARRLRLDPDTKGVIITDVEPGGAASRAGLSRGDILLQVNRRPVTSVAEASRELGRVASGSTAFLLVLRGGTETFITVRKE